MSYLQRIRACNRWDPEEFVPFQMPEGRVGYVRRTFAEHLRRWPAVFRIDGEALRWIASAKTFGERTDCMAEITAGLLEIGAIDYLHGERYPVTLGQRTQALFLLDRACAPYFGIRAYGQHLNGFVRDAQGLALWVARRSPHRRTFPNRLDHLVAGGLPWGLSLEENLRKEAEEEAGIPPDLIARAVPVGAITYCYASARGLKPDVMYCYDLELPADFVPRCTDGEVQSFQLQPVEQVMEIVRETEAFKLNCNLVLIDFLIRHGLITPDEPDYLDLLRELHPPLP